MIKPLDKDYFSYNLSCNRHIFNLIEQHQIRN